MPTPGSQPRITTRRVLRWTLLSVCLWLPLPACNWHGYGALPKPSVEELFHEAMMQSSLHPERTYAADVRDHGPLPLHTPHVAPPTVAPPRIEGELLNGGLVVPTQFEETVPPPPGTFPDFGNDEPENNVGGDGGGLLVNQEFIDTDIREALGLMATDAEVDLIVDEKVSGVVNTSIEDLPVETALEKVLLPFGYVYAKQGERYIVAPNDPASPLFHHIAVQIEYRPQNLEGKDLIASLSTQSQAFVREITNANILVIDAPQPHADKILRRLQQVDQPVPQVNLEAIVCVVSPDSGFRFGVDWNHAVDISGSTALRAGATGLGLSGTFSGLGADNAFRDFAVTTAFVRKLADHGYLSIRAAPRVVAKDGEKANISINRETFFSTQPINNANADNGAFFFNQDIERVESGITLDITPRIRGNIVTVDIEKAEVSEDIRNANTELSVNPFPIINRRSVSTTVHVEDGKTIVIGGLVQRQAVERVRHVPGFSRLPFCGKLFQTIETQEQDAEVVIFISPKIVTPPCATECLPVSSTHQGAGGR